MIFLKIKKSEDGKNIVFLNPSDTENGFYIESKARVLK